MESYQGDLRNNKDEGYKSRGEEQIARLLDKNGIAYRYEQPILVVDLNKHRIWYPDFYLPEYGIIIEYFGVNGKQSYDEQAKHKIRAYKNNGIEGLFLTEACFKGDWPGDIMGQIEKILKNRLKRFYSRLNQRK